MERGDLMCGQYYIHKETWSLIEKMGIKYDEDDEFLCSPKQSVPLLIFKEGHFHIKKMIWGYPLRTSKQLVIHARSETIFERPLFQQDILARRCLFLAHGFYEKDAHRRRFAFESQDNTPLFIGGIYNQEGQAVMITQKANHVMQPIHSRMPLIIKKENLLSWFDDCQYQEILQTSQDTFKIVSGLFQTSLFEDMD